jgi:hypothetical protein
MTALILWVLSAKTILLLFNLDNVYPVGINNLTRFCHPQDPTGSHPNDIVSAKKENSCFNI